CEERPDYDYGDHAEIRVYSLKEDEETGSVVYGMDQKEEISVTVKKKENQIHINVTSNKDYTIRLINVAASGQGAVKDGNDTVVTLSGNADITLTEN
ncbi:MAG: hypothetical protein K2P07_07230, partial [Lachnospiraceae bacterium]|nr:hypothetical protein [Lachnospiraceae bacterium]